MNQAFNLYQLQKIDTQIDQIDARLAVLQAELDNDVEVQQVAGFAQAQQKILDQNRKNLRRLEDATSAIKIKIATSDANLYGGKVKNPKELQDIQKEIASLRKNLATLEDEQLEAMLTVEQSELEYNTASQSLSKVQAASLQKKSGLAGEITQFQKNKERLLIEKSAATQQITEENLTIYQNLRKSKKGKAVSTIDEGSCSGCGSELRPAEWQAARSPNKIVYCSSCGRILYAG